ncbi:RCC1 domain-containing protein [Paenibacillus spongiae]|uniref:RCC1-like domain-containing protein n=1 Tax=Paenibacillus spongiae TaxID=2909671 RepID=A0ABY5S8H2_9BACL|nr:hypothetical protein [Paenibacillus spongiae]UVI29095.1 hypothetical protein L1F29_27240 [Paenibacillus spongiae]
MEIRFRRLMGIICFLFAFVILSNTAFAAESGDTVQALGDNNSQIADGSPTNDVASVTDTVYLAGGCSHSLALGSDGIVWAWGDNYWGELGDGTTTNHTTPIPVKSLDGVHNIAARECKSLALLNDGTVWGWGIQLPFGSDQDSAPGPTPRQVNDKSGHAFDSVVAISAGAKHNLALKSDGTVWAWGGNEYGQLGDGTVSDQYSYEFSPVQAQGLDSVVAVAAGMVHSLALKSDGTVWAWGGESSIPVQVQGLDSVVAIAAGATHSVALKSDGTVWTWGDNNYGQLGDGTTTARTTPVQLASLANVVGVAAGSYYSMALKNDGTVWTWGDNYWGQLGDGSTTQRPTPAQVEDLDSVTSIAAGDNHSLVLKSDGSAWGWGDNGSGQLSDESTTKHLIPIKIQGLGNRGPESILYRFKGTIFDFDASRILWRQLENYWDESVHLNKQRYVYWLYNRADQSQVRVFENADPYHLVKMELSAKGVVYDDGHNIHYWKDGAVQYSWDGQNLEVVNGNFAILGNSVVNVTTGESRSLPNADFIYNRDYDLSADGTVVYTSHYLPSTLYKSLPDGTLTTYEPPSPDTHTFYGALTDGKTLIYNELLQNTGRNSKWALRVRSANDRITTLATNPFDPSDYAADPRDSYQINNGWIAYKKADEETGRWVLDVRSPEGVIKQVYAAPHGSSWKDVPLSIKQLAPDGTLAYTYQDTTYVYSAQAGTILYSFNDPGELEYREHVLKDIDGVEYRFLAWYRLDGGLLYGVRF